MRDKAETRECSGMVVRNVGYADKGLRGLPFLILATPGCPLPSSKMQQCPLHGGSGGRAPCYLASCTPVGVESDANYPSPLVCKGEEREGAERRQATADQTTPLPLADSD